MFASFAERSNEAELMDGADYTDAELIENLADLRRVNRYLGGGRALTRHLFPMIEALGRRRVSLLDVGSGSGDIPARIVSWARGRGIEVECVALDMNEIVAIEARRRTASYPEIEVVRADAMKLPFEDGSFDFALASMFLHHFESPQAFGTIPPSPSCAASPNATSRKSLTRHGSGCRFSAIFLTVLF
jgi:SAM-dependent methyltransferase